MATAPSNHAGRGPRASGEVCQHLQLLWSRLPYHRRSVHRSQTPTIAGSTRTANVRSWRLADLVE